MAPGHRIEILNLEADPDGVSDYRMLVDGKSFKYVTIDCGMFSIDDMCFPPVFIPQLPTFPEGDWNEGHIAADPDTHNPYFSRYDKVELPAVVNLWHSEQIDWHDFERDERKGRLRSNIYIATLKRDIGSMKLGDEVVIKFAKFPWEMRYFEEETQAYERVACHGFGPKFLGHLMEEGRCVGLVIEFIKNARHAGPEDVDVCQDEMRKLHGLGLLHGDVNRHNFLVREVEGRKMVTVVDLETVVECTDEQAFEEEIDMVKEELQSTSKMGGHYIRGEDEEG